MRYSPHDPGAPQRPGQRRPRAAFRFAAVLAAALMLAPALPTTTHAAANKVHPKLSKAATGDLVDVLVTLDPNADWSAIARVVGAKFIKHWDLSATVRLQVPADKLADLSAIPGVRWVTPNARVVATGLTTVSNTFASTVHAPTLWNMGLQGDGVTVAVLDTGIADNRDLPSSVVSQYAGSFPDGVDRMGHGTAVAGLIVGASPNGSFRGIAPRARLLSVKVLGDDGSGTVADVLNGLEWVNQNRREYNIRVVNLSLTAGVVDSYKKNPINAAVEALWFNGVVVVAAAGNRGTADMAVATAPGNDPFAITVGSTDDRGTADITDDILASFSSRGATLDGFTKPDLTSPGAHVVTTLAPNSQVEANATSWFVGGDLVQMSGTSLSAPMVSGAAALLLQARPSLTPDQVKWLLTKSSRRYPNQPDNAGELDIAGAVTLAASLPAVPAANQGIVPADGILGTAEGALVDQVYWDQVYWDQVYWDQVYWDQVYWDQ